MTTVQHVRSLCKTMHRALPQVRQQLAFNGNTSVHVSDGSISVRANSRRITRGQTCANDPALYESVVGMHVLTSRLRINWDKHVHIITKRVRIVTIYLSVQMIRTIRARSDPFDMCRHFKVRWARDIFQRPSSQQTGRASVGKTPLSLGRLVK